MLGSLVSRCIHWATTCSRAQWTNTGRSRTSGLVKFSSECLRPRRRLPQTVRARHPCQPHQPLLRSLVPVSTRTQPYSGPVLSTRSSKYGTFDPKPTWLISPDMRDLSAVCRSQRTVSIWPPRPKTPRLNCGI